MSDTPHDDTSRRLTLRELPLPARLVLSVFLLSAGISYFYGLIQIHFQDAGHGELLPDKGSQKKKFAGIEEVSVIERLVREPENRPFSASGTMRTAFFKKSSGWSSKIGKKARENKIDRDKAEEILRAERQIEIDALLAWINAGGKEVDYARFPLPAKHAGSKYLPKDDTELFEEAEGKWIAKIDKIVEMRCARCHNPSGGGAAGQVHLDNYAGVKDYLDPEKGGGMSLQKRAQTTHVHAFGFSMLYALTGLILAFSTYPVWLRLLLCPLPLVAMVLELMCWWLPLANPMYADFVEPLAIASAMGLMLHIVLSLLNMYGVVGKLVLLLMFATAGAGGGFLLKTQVVDPFLKKEKVAVAADTDD